MNKNKKRKSNKWESRGKEGESREFWVRSQQEKQLPKSERMQQAGVEKEI
ncbi:hypothetical protein [Methanosarcina sp. KYL-1]|nr:hypothetical protein [Methanosarcina sp. KYL-1]